MHSRMLKTVAMLSCSVVFAWVLAQNGPTGELRVGMGAIAPELDPHMQVQAYSRTVYTAVFDTLTAVDAHGLAQPALATSWTLLDDLTWQFELRRDVSFHDGEVFDADTVVFTLERIIDPDTTTRVRPRIPFVEAVEAVDGHTVIITTSEPDPLLPKRLADIYIVPRLYLTEVGPEVFTNQPVGTGPFRVSSWARDEYIVLEAIETSWRGVPRISEITLYMLPESASRIAAFRSGEIDIVQNVGPDQAVELQQAGFRIVSAPVARTHVINLRSAIDGPLQSPLVRQALNYAVDKEAIVNLLMRGFADVAAGQIVGPDGFGHDQGLEAFPYDPDRARALLQEAGHGAGFTVQLNGTQGAFLYDRETLEAIQAFLADVGIRVEIRINESATHSQLAWDGAHAPMWMHAWNYFPALDAEFAIAWFESSHAMGIYDNPAFDELLHASRTTMDPGEREALLQQIMAVMQEDPPALFLFHPHDIFAVAEEVEGFVPSSDTFMRFDGVYREE